MKKNNVLVTGANGYIGSVLCRILLEKGYTVYALDKFDNITNPNIELTSNSHYVPIRGDVLNKDLISELVSDVDTVIPLAALVGAPLCGLYPDMAKLINQDAIEFLCQTMKDNQKLVLPTTNSGYGAGKRDSIYDENSPINPISIYGKTKMEAERFAISRGNSVSLRLATVFGVSPKMRKDLLVNDFVYRALIDKTVTIFEGHFIRNYIHIKDVALGIIHVLQNWDKMSGNIYNLGLSNANLSKIDLCERIKTQIPTFNYIVAEIGEDPDKRNYVVSNTKIESTGWKPQFTLEDGIKELIKCYRILNYSIVSNY